MQTADWVVLSLFFAGMVFIGLFSYSKVKSSNDFFVAGGGLPWWLSGISHHVSGYSGAVFVAYAALAYNEGFTIYVWWAFTIGIATWAGSGFLAPLWSRLRDKLQVQSPLEYLSIRYNIATQQVMAWSGSLLKLFDVGAKWAAIALILNTFTGIPIAWGVALSGGISILYITIGGIWADVLTDFAQFIVQFIAGTTMFVVVLMKLGGISSLWTIWDRLPENNASFFNEHYPPAFALTFLFINFLSYNGGTWNLAMRFMSSPTGADARRAARLSSMLYLIWPLILFFPMWAAPILLPGLEDPSRSYSILAQQLLPTGLVGLVLAAMFAATMSMTTSDSNTVASVISRDILPTLFHKFKNLSESASLRLARIVTFGFTAATLLLALQAKHFGGVLGLIVSWYGALLGPVAIPMLGGLLPAFRRCTSTSALLAVFCGFAAFLIVKYALTTPLLVQVAAPVFTSFAAYALSGLLNRKEVSPAVDRLLAELHTKSKT